MARMKLGSLLNLGASLITLSLPSAAFAQAQDAAQQEPADPGEAVPGDIVVTAQKRAQSLQDVAASVTALGSDSLAAMGRQDVTALAGQVPSPQVNQYSPTITIFNLRGVSQNDFADSQEAPIAFYADEVYVASLGAISGRTSISNASRCCAARRVRCSAAMPPAVWCR